MENKVYLLWQDITQTGKHNNRFELLEVYSSKEKAQEALRDLINTHQEVVLEDNWDIDIVESVDDMEGDDPNTLYQIDLTATKNNFTLKICAFIDGYEVK